MKAFYRYNLVWKGWRPDLCCLILSYQIFYWMLGETLIMLGDSKFIDNIYFNKIVCKRWKGFEETIVSQKSLAKFHCLENSRTMIPWDTTLCLYCRNANLQTSYSKWRWNIFLHSSWTNLSSSELFINYQGNIKLPINDITTSF